MEVGRDVVVVDVDGANLGHTSVFLNDLTDAEIAVSGPHLGRVLAGWQLSHVPFIRPAGRTLDEELLCESIRARDGEPNLLDIAAVRSLVGVRSRALEENAARAVFAALRGDVDQQGWRHQVELVLSDHDGRVVQSVVRTNTERDVAFTLGVGSAVPFVDPILERVGFHGDVAVRARGVGSIEPVRGSWRLNLDTLDQTELSLVGGVVVGIGPLGTVPCLAADSHRAGERIAVGFAHADARAQVLEVDDVVNRAREHVGEVITAAAELEGFNGIERTLSTVEAVRIVAVHVRVAIVVNAVSARVLVNDDGLTRAVVGPWNSGVLVTDHMVPISVKEEIRWQRHLRGEPKGVGREFVERKAG